MQENPAKIAKKGLIGIISIYRNTLAYMKLPTCRFVPSCSVYAIDSIERFGVLRGLLKISIRVLRCHPFSRGGYDPAK